MTAVLVYTLILVIIFLVYFNFVRKIPNYPVTNFRLVSIHRWNLKLSRLLVWVTTLIFLLLVKFLMEGNLPFPNSPSLPHIYAMVILPSLYLVLIAELISLIKEAKDWCLRLGVSKAQLISAPIMCCYYIYCIGSNILSRWRKNNYRAR